MPPQKKKMLRRKIAQAFQHEQRTVEIMLELGEIFGEHHKDYEEYFQAIGQCSLVVMGFIQDVAVKAWGFWPDNIETWLK